MNSLTKNRPQDTHHEKTLLWHVEDSVHNDEWDSFLAKNNGHHVQTAMWSRVKSIKGWSTTRIIVSTDGRILGGAQILAKRLGMFGSVGYAPKILEPQNYTEGITDALLDQIRKVAKSTGLQVLFVQPADYGPMAERLEQLDFRPCPVETAPSATILVDLSDDLDTILAKMNKGMRNGIRRSQKRGIVVREGNRDDLISFHKLLSATSRRRGFSPFELDYFQGMWDVLEPAGAIKVFLSELEGEPVSAQICIPFGDTVVAKQIGWSGHHGRLHPNEALDWFTIQWSKTNGYQYYDLEGIERPAAQAIVSGRPLPERFADSPTAFKLRFGGVVKLYPSAYCYVANPLLRALYNRVGYQVAHWPIFQKAVGRFRTG